MTDPTKPRLSTTELAFARMGAAMADPLPNDQIGSRGEVIHSAVTGDQRKRIQQSIDRTMLDVIQDARRSNPITGGGQLPTVTPAGAAPARTGPVIRGNGWAKEIPIETPGGRTAMAAIDALADSFQPHGVGNPQRREGKKGGG